MTTTVYADDHRFESTDVFGDKCKHCSNRRVMHCDYTRAESDAMMRGSSSVDPTAIATATALAGATN